MPQEQSPADEPSDLYKKDMEIERRNLRAVLKTDAVGAHVGLAVTVISVTIVAFFAGLAWGGIVATPFALWFIGATIVSYASHGLNVDIFRRAYIATFGWGDYI